MDCVVNIVDTTAPIITLTGTNPQTLEAGKAYTELGATALDNADGDITAAITIDASAVDNTSVGSYSVSYNVTDAAGNAAVTLTRTVNVVDTTAPTVSSTSPTASATGVARNTTITATFDEDIFATTVDGSSFTLANGGSISGVVSFDGLTNIATFSPASNLAILTPYTATLTTAITDLSGNPLETDYTWTFTTVDGAWSSAGLIETNNAGDAWNPRIAIDGSGNAIAVWFQSDGTRHNIWANRFD